MSVPMDEVNDPCPICKGSLEDRSDVVQIRQKGVDSIDAASVQRGDNLEVVDGFKVHTNCRKRYINQQDIQNKQNNEGKYTSSMKRSSRVLTWTFNSKYDCLFCGTTVQMGTLDYSYVRTDDFAKTVQEYCDNRSDAWAITVKGRIEYYSGDLHAADCII